MLVNVFYLHDFCYYLTLSHPGLFMLRNIIILITLLILQVSEAVAESRIKDIVYFEGIRENMLVGYGLVVGLNGTGDNLKNAVFTEKGLTRFLEKLGMHVGGGTLNTKNVAAVTVTAILPPFSRAGSRISVDISTIGDAKSLKGGLLIVTPLVGADGEVYAIAQGPVSIGSKPADEANKPDTTSPTTGFVSGGAIVEREVSFDFASLKKMNLALKDPDISTARSIELAINNAIRSKIATALDPGTVELSIPEKYKDNPMTLLADVENVTVYPDSVAKIIIDEATGTIVIGQNVTISRVAIAQGNLVVKVSDEEQFLYRIGAGDGVQPQKSERGMEMTVFEEAARLSELVDGLNALGVRPRDLVAILKTIKQAGALHAEIVVK